MTYQQIVDMLRDSANAVNPNGFFHHGRREDFSLQYPQVAFRTGYAGIGLLSPTPRTTVDKINAIVTHECIMVFMEQDAPDSTEDNREDIIARMYVLSEQFMDYIYNNYPVAISNEVKTPDYRQFMATLSGYSMTFTISDVISCEEIPPYPTECEPATISNSDDTFTVEIPSGDFYELPDEEYEVIVEDEIVSVGSFPVYGNYVINIDL